MSHAHELLRIGPAGRVAEDGTGQTEFPRLQVHRVRETLFGPAHRFRQQHRGIVTGLHDHAADQVFHHDLLANFDEHPRAADRGGLGRHRQRVRQFHLTFFQPLVDQIHGHELGHRRWRHLLIGAFIQQHRAGGEILHERPFRGRIHRAQRCLPRRARGHRIFGLAFRAGGEHARGQDRQTRQGGRQREASRNSHRIVSLAQLMTQSPINPTAIA